MCVNVSCAFWPLSGQSKMKLDFLYLLWHTRHFTVFLFHFLSSESLPCATFNPAMPAYSTLTLTIVPWRNSVQIQTRRETFPIRRDSRKFPSAFLAADRFIGWHAALRSRTMLWFSAIYHFSVCFSFVHQGGGASAHSRTPALVNYIFHCRLCTAATVRSEKLCASSTNSVKSMRDRRWLGSERTLIFDWLRAITENASIYTVCTDLFPRV